MPPAATLEPTDLAEFACSGDPCCEEICDHAGALGDPHIFTFDGLQYSCQGQGDYLLLKTIGSDNDGLEIQGKFAKRSNQVSFAKGVAVKTGSSGPTVTVLYPQGSSSVQILVDDKVKTLSEGYDDAFVRVTTVSATTKIFVKNARVAISAKEAPISFSHFGVTVSVPRSYSQGKTFVGLFGSADGDPLNDWMNATGAAIAIPTSGLAQQAGYEYCTSTWCIRDESEVLFAYTASAPFDAASCDESYPGSLDTSSATADLRALCGTDQACLTDGIELGIPGAQNLLESVAALGTSSFLEVTPDAIEVGTSVNLVLTIDLRGNTAVPSGLERFLIFRVDQVTRQPVGTSIVSLIDEGFGFGNDTVAGDLVFSNVLAISFLVAGEIAGYQAVPVIDGVTDASSDLVVTRLGAVRSFSPESGVGDKGGAVTGNATTIELASIVNTTLAIQYSWPSDQNDLDTSTRFLGANVGYSCGSASQYLTFTGDDTSTGGIEIARVLLGESFSDGAWSGMVTTTLFAGWFGCPERGPASVSVYTERTTASGVVVPDQNAVSFVIDPSCQTGCAAFPVGEVVVTVNVDASVSIEVVQA